MFDRRSLHDFYLAQRAASGPPTRNCPVAAHCGGGCRSAQRSRRRRTSRIRSPLGCRARTVPGARGTADPPRPLGRRSRCRGLRRDGVHGCVARCAAGGRVRRAGGTLSERETDRVARAHDHHSWGSGRTHVRGRHLRTAVLGGPVGPRSGPGTARLADRATPGRQPRDWHQRRVPRVRPQARPTRRRRRRHAALAESRGAAWHGPRRSAPTSAGCGGAAATDWCEPMAPPTRRSTSPSPANCSSRGRPNSASGFHGCTNGSPSSTARTRHDGAEPVRLPWRPPPKAWRGERP